MTHVNESRLFYCQGDPAVPVPHDPAVPVPHDPAVPVPRDPAVPVPRDPAVPVQRDPAVPVPRFEVTCDTFGHFVQLTCPSASQGAKYKKLSNVSSKWETDDPPSTAL